MIIGSTEGGKIRTVSVYVLVVFILLLNVIEPLAQLVEKLWLPTLGSVLNVSKADPKLSSGLPKGAPLSSSHACIETAVPSIGMSIPDQLTVAFELGLPKVISPLPAFIIK